MIKLTVFSRLPLCPCPSSLWVSEMLILKVSIVTSCFFCFCTDLWVVGVSLYVHRNPRLIRDGSPGRPPRLSHSSWTLSYESVFKINMIRMFLEKKKRVFFGTPFLLLFQYNLFILKVNLRVWLLVFEWTIQAPLWLQFFFFFLTVSFLVFVKFFLFLIKWVKLYSIYLFVYVLFIICQRQTSDFPFYLV